MLERSVQQLVAEGEFRQAADLLKQKRELAASDLLSQATLEFYLGDPATALREAESLLNTALDSPSRAQALCICGRSLGRLGSAERGAAVLRKAIALAGTLDAALEAELRAQLVQDVLSWFGVEPAVVELPILRECALRSGNALALAHYHIARARIAALRGPLNTATGELQRAFHLLCAHPHADTEWFLQHVRAGIASMEGDVTEALKCARECLNSARVSRSSSRIGYALGNLANISVTSGNFEQARECLDECLRVLPASSRARFAVLHTGLHLALLTNDGELAERMIADGLSTSQFAGAEHSYYRLWFELNRLKWLARHGHSPVEIVAEANAALQPAARLADKELHDRLALLIAEIQYENGDVKDSALLLAAATPGHDTTPPYLIELYRVAALLAGADKATSSVLLASALRLLTSAKLFGLQGEVERTAHQLVIDLNENSEPTADEILCRIGVCLALGRHPRILGEEICGLLTHLRICDWAYVTESASNDRRTSAGEKETAQDRLTISLGDGRGRAYSIVAALPDRSKQVQWSAIERVCLSASALQNRVETSTDSESSWFASSRTIEGGIVAAADKSHDLLRTTKKLAQSNITVLITGETGTGKELYAKALHDSSPRSAKPFIPFNCSAVSREMLDAQLFGYRKGAFTGAADAFQGVIRAAAGGTLFLDEIGEVALDVQPKLLRFLESGEIHPLGEPRPIAVDVRVVAATNANLEQLVDEGRFREDLFYRLNVVRLHVPPLRERREEIPPLVQHFLDKHGRDAHKTGLRVADETMEYLILFKWPGNVRQLGNEIRRMVALAESNAVLMPEHLSPEIAASRRTIPASERYIAPTEFVVRMDQPMSAAMEHLERSMIQYALKLSSGRVEDAATRLGLSRKGLYLKRQRLALLDAEADRQPAVSA